MPTVTKCNHLFMDYMAGCAACGKLHRGAYGGLEMWRVVHKPSECTPEKECFEAKREWKTPETEQAENAEKGKKR